MRYVLGFLGCFALGLVLSLGCSESGGEGGSGGTAGTGGMAGTGGSAGTMGQVFPCTEQGIRDAIAEGGGPHFFACDGPITVATEAEIVIDNDVVLDGQGNVTVDGNDHVVFSILETVTATLRGFGVTNGADGIRNDGTLTVTNSTVSGSPFDGIYNDGTLTLTNSTVSGIPNNGLRNHGELIVINSTVSGNPRPCQGLVCFSNIDAGGRVTLINSTVSGIRSADGTLMLANTLVTGECEILVGATVASNGHNIESPGNTCGFDTDKGDLFDVTPEQLNLGELADNGGPTETHALLTEPTPSVAIDRIPSEDCVDADGQPLTTDQRGLPRPAGTTDPKKCDVGAFEVQP